MRQRPAALLLLAALLACARNPVTGRPEIALRSSAREAELGAEAARQVEESIGLVEDPALAGYVAALGGRLAQRSPRRDVAYRFFVADMAEPNAFALPGGYVFVSWGLLAIVSSEDELANVLAHEVVHVAARHAVQRETRALPVGILSALGTLAGGVVGGEALARAIGAIPQIAGGLLLASYSRDQEREADRVGQELAAQAGWDPAAMATFLETMQAALALEQAGGAGAAAGARPGFFDSHPSTPERARSALQRAAGLERGPEPPLAPTRAAFLERLEGMRIGPDPAQGIFRDELYLHPDLDFALRFPPGWRTYNARDAVAAAAPEGDALVVLRVQGRGDDPRAAAVAFAREHGLTLTEPEPFSVDGLPAVRALAGVQGRRGAFVADFSFVAHAGLVFRITGAAPLSLYESRARSLAGTARSFRRLSETERASFTTLRLRVARAGAGETLAALAARTASAWPAARLAFANGLDPGRPLAAGEPVKIAVEEPYVPAAASP